MTKYFPATHSTLSVKALIAEVLSGYEIPKVSELKFLNIGLNDTYVAQVVGGKKYILRIYRANWRSHSEVAYEIEVLNYLGRQGTPVAQPIRRKDGRFIQPLEAIEGKRYAVLFAYALGTPLTYEEDDNARSFNYGKVAAKIHSSSQDFSSAHTRFSLDLNHLMEEPLVSIGPMLSHRSDDWQYLQKLADVIRDCFAAFPSSELEKGFCHGDLHGGNVHFSKDDAAMVFDFDGCGVGWRAYDLSVWRWSARLREKEKICWEPFLSGYQSERSLSEIDLKAIPLFIGIRHFFLLGIHTSNGQDWGFGWMNDKYFDKAIEFLKAWEEEHLLAK
ncbi:MAG: phosphotransferase [Cyanobacteria bacterium P01_D01_bin.36]